MNTEIAVIVITAFIVSFAVVTMLRTATILRQSAARIRELEAEKKRDLADWMCSWCGQSPVDCVCNAAMPTRAGRRVWQCVSCGEQPKHCECAA